MKVHMKSYFVYIARCSDGLFYVGITNNVDKRESDHNLGLDPTAFTYKRRPVKVVRVECFYDVKAAIAREKQLKGWSHAKKEALVHGDFDEVSRLSKIKKCKRK